jgi:microcystin-dependent protein
MGLAGTLRASNLVNAINGFQVNGTSLASTHLSDSAALARLASPVLTGNPTGPTPAQDDNDFSLATTAFVIGQLSTSTPIVDGTGAVGTSLRMARADHVHPTDASRAPLASPTLTGIPLAPTPTPGDSSTKIATTAFVASAGGVPSGTILQFAGISTPVGFLACDGTAQLRASFPTLFAALVASIGTATVTIAAPGVWTLNAHGLVNGDVIYIETTGALPTGLSADTAYFVVAATTNTFQVATTKGGTGITTTGTQSGTHTAFRAPWALGTMSATTFNVPDTRGVTLVNKNGATFQNLGSKGGEETHLITNTEMPTHAHGGSTSAVSAGTPAGTVSVVNAGVITTGVDTTDHVHAGTTSGVSTFHTHSYNDRNTVNGQSYGAGSFPYATNAVATLTSTDSTDHSHSFTTGGRSANHQHDVPAHGHTATFAGSALGTHTHTISNDGGSTAHNNLQPYGVINHIIKT